MLILSELCSEKKVQKVAQSSIIVGITANKKLKGKQNEAHSTSTIISNQVKKYLKYVKSSNHTYSLLLYHMFVYICIV